jgi:transitional endoplasmic reticulum ATPase
MNWTALPQGRGQDAGNNVSERVVNQLLTELDGLEQMEGVMVIAATNRPDIIDPALIRSGRFDRLVMVGQPSESGREEILRIHTQETPLSPDVSLREVAERTEGYVGSDLATVAREAAIEALRDDPDAENVGMPHFRSALEDVRATVTDDLLDYYEQVEEELTGGTGPAVAGRDQERHIGFQ